MKTIILKYMTRTKTGSFEYRRQVPKELRDIVGKYEFKKVLGLTETAAIKAWPTYNSWVERQIADARKPKTATAEAISTAREDFSEALTRLQKLGIDPTEPLYREPGELIEADIVAENFQVADKIDSLAVGMLNGSGNVRPPMATFEDAKRLYIKAKVEGEDNEKIKLQRVGRVADYMQTALGKDLPLDKLTRSHAREVIAHMLSLGISPATVHRYANDIRAIINYGITEFELGNVAFNPFIKIEIKGLKTTGKSDRDERNPFSPKQLEQTRARVIEHAGADLGIIWRLLEGTGARLSEIAGLEVQDVVVDGTATPHIDIRFNALRRLKNNASVRKVPLAGDALAAATEALSGKVDGPLFKRYGRDRGGDAASAALMKSVRKIVSDKRVTVHSLRHNMQDRMIKAGVSEHDRKLILGHAINGEGNRYGSDAARLEVTTAAMRLTVGVTQ
ncbi:tyrosine-type recombinase/integrase [Phyllobacterium sp.]|uniref:tyrosine-type recombinase/integrase n=1 Tax=unclassified Phyllobacterium TaxID=2638441 RepID=UPI0031FD64B5|nr:tyrosine-type recombinase/integrase [Phyllobacterium sp.]